MRISSHTLRLPGRKDMHPWPGVNEIAPKKPRRNRAGPQLGVNPSRSLRIGPISEAEVVDETGAAQEGRHQHDGGAVHDFERFEVVDGA